MTATKQTNPRKDDKYIRMGMALSCGIMPAMALADPSTPVPVRVIAGSALLVPPALWLAMDWARARGWWISKR